MLCKYITAAATIKGSSHTILVQAMAVAANVFGWRIHDSPSRQPLHEFFSVCSSQMSNVVYYVIDPSLGS